MAHSRGSWWLLAACSILLNIAFAQIQTVLHENDPALLILREEPISDHFEQSLQTPELAYVDVHRNVHHETITNTEPEHVHGDSVISDVAHDEHNPPVGDHVPQVNPFKPLPPVPVERHLHVEQEQEQHSQVQDYHQNDFISRLEHNCRRKSSFACAQRALVHVIDTALDKDTYQLIGGVTIVRNRGSRRIDEDLASDATDVTDYIIKRIGNFAQNHVMRVDLSPITTTARSARFLFGLLRPKWLDIFNPTETGKTGTFMTGFGLGFLAFGLKKLLLPIFIAAQIVKSVLIAMFLPTILGGLGKIVGKGVSTFAQTSTGLSGGLSGGGLHGDATNTVEDFEFKDQSDYDNHDGKTADSKYSYSFNYPDTPYSGNQQPIGTLPAASIYVPGNNRYQQPASPKVSYVADNNNNNGNYYQRHQANKQDYKVFHNIPSSSLLLTTYDPFYSPLLSRLDSVFKQLGYATEACRERLICAMYRNPAKFAPYSNLVSAQLSRELNELRKPSSDNPEILRFFRYMKAAKNGQDGQDCFIRHPGCFDDDTVTSPPMVKTYNDINKLVQARRLARQMRRLELSVGMETSPAGQQTGRSFSVPQAGSSTTGQNTGSSTDRQQPGLGGDGSSPNARHHSSSATGGSSDVGDSTVEDRDHPVGSRHESPGVIVESAGQKSPDNIAHESVGVQGGSVGSPRLDVGARHHSGGGGHGRGGVQSESVGASHELPVFRGDLVDDTDGSVGDGGEQVGVQSGSVGVVHGSVGVRRDSVVAKDEPFRVESKITGARHHSTPHIGDETSSEAVDTTQNKNEHDGQSTHDAHKASAIAVPKR